MPRRASAATTASRPCRQIANRSASSSSLSIVDNFAIGFIHQGRFGSAMRIDRARMSRATKAAVSEFEVQGVRSLWQRAGLLSGGNAQKN